MAQDFAAAGFAVIYQDVIVGADLERVVAMLDPQQQPIHVIVLAPSAAVAASRDVQRNKTAYIAWTAAELDASLREETAQIGLWLDTSALTVEDTVDAILNRLPDARM